MVWNMRLRARSSQSIHWNQMQTKGIEFSRCTTCLLCDYFRSTSLYDEKKQCWDINSPSQIYTTSS
jgi:hypothetical protein